MLEAIYFVFANEGYGNAVAFGTGGASDAVNIVLWIVRHVVVYHHGNVIDVDASSHDVGSHEHVYLSRLELIQNLVAFSLLQVGVHLARVYLHLHQRAVDGLHLLLLAREYDDAVEVALGK